MVSFGVGKVGRAGGYAGGGTAAGLSLRQPPDQTAVLQLVSILESMIDLQKKFLALLAEEKKCITGRNVQGFFQCLNDKESLLGQIRYFEERRKKAMAALSKEVGADSLLTLRDIVAWAPEPYRGRLRLCHVGLHDLTVRVIDAHRANNKLSAEVLTRMKSLVGFLKGMMTCDTVYKATGALGEFRPFRRTIGKA